MINQEAKKILENTFKDAIKMLGLKDCNIHFVYECIGTRFLTTNNSSELSGDTLYINECWANDVVKSYKYDLYFMMAHEARHLYQLFNVNAINNSQIHSEKNIELVKKWEDNFSNYTRNSGNLSKKDYVCQPVEVDANAFACFYCLFKRKGQPRIAPEADELTTNRLFEIAESYGVTLK